jgi:carbamoyl-phosphate synthase large subunit
MNVLLIAAGRRVSLAWRFIEHGFNVYAYEAETNCPISNAATVVEGKKWDDAGVREHIMETIEKIQPDLVLPLADKATTILSNINYKGIVTASKQANDICLDKKKFENTFKECSFYPIVEKDCPVILKPIFGANSKGLHRLSYNEYISQHHKFTNTHVAQKMINGFEISVDAYFNKFSKMIDGVPRIRTEVQGGEVSRSTTLSRDAYGVLDLTKQVGEQIGLVGPVCAQYIVGDKPYIMEINSRFGGGVILSMEAGFDQIQLLHDEWVLGKICTPNPHNWKKNFSMTRYFQEYFYGGTDG